MFSKLRNIFFWISIAAYFISAPLIIVYAFGYKWEYREIALRETGIISLKSYPEKADIYINNLLYEYKTPSWISGLTPANYKVKVAKAGFWDWEKALEVKPRMVTKAENILLVPRDIQPEPIFKDLEVRDFVASKFTKEIIALARDATGAYGFFSIGGAELKPKRIPIKNISEFSYDIFRNLNLDSLSKGSQFLLAYDESAFSKRYFLASIAGERLLFINEKFNINPSEIKWSEIEDGILYFINDKFIGRLDIPNEKIFISAFRADSFDMIGDRIYLFNKMNNTVSLVDPTLKDINIIARNDYLTELIFKKYSSSGYRLLKGKNFFNIFKDNLAVIVTDKGDLFLTKPPYLIANKVKSVVFSDDGNNLIYYNEKIYDFSIKLREEGEDLYFSPIPEKKEIFSPKGKVNSIFFFTDNMHIIFNDGENLVITELDTRDKRNTNNIWKRSINEKFFYSSPDDKLYFIDLDKTTNKRNLYRVNFYRK